MPLAGDLSGFSVDEVISLIMRGGKSGRLVLKNDTAESSLYFDTGVIVEAMHGPVRGSGALASALTAFISGQFAFYEGERTAAPSMRVDESGLSRLAQQTHVETETMAPVLPDIDEKLALMLSFTDSPSLTPFQWLLLAQIPQRCTLRHLSEGRDRCGQKALSPLLVSGLVQRTGQIVSAGTGGVRWLWSRGTRGRKRLSNLIRRLSRDGAHRASSLDVFLLGGRCSQHWPGRDWTRAS